MSYEKQFFEATDVFSSCFVFASAGSGKTKILVDRYVKSLFFGIKPQEILCLTFTNAAVFEMQSRISSILEKLYLNENGYTKQYIEKTFNIQNTTDKDIKKAESLFFDFQDNLENLKILTIHAFCQELLQKFPIEADVNPNFEIIDDTEAFRLLDMAKQESLSQISETLLNEIASNMSSYSFEDFVNRIYSQASKFSRFFSLNTDLEVYEKSLSTIFKKRDLIKFSNEQIEKAKEFFGDANLEEALLTKTGTIRKKLPKSEIIYQIAEVVFENSLNIKRGNTINKTISFLKIAKDIFDRYNDLKKKQNALDFFDVLNKAEFLLTKSIAKEFVMSKVCRKFKSVMIDEAQDLSSIQWNLVKLFSDEIFSDEYSRNTIFVVGDIKQSIYRFQDANCRLFIEFYEYCIRSLKYLNKPFNTVYLNICYRSLPKILESVDSVFEGEVGRFAFGQSSIDYKKHIPYRCERQGIVDLQNIEHLADTIEDLLGAKKVAPNDILILTRSRSEVSENIINELTRKNIKVAPPDRILLTNEILIMDMLAIMDICIDRENDYAMACVLKSPYIFETPLTNEDLFHICHNRVHSVFEILEIKYRDHFKLVNEIIAHFRVNKLVEFTYYLATKIILIKNKKEQDVLNAFINQTMLFENKNTDNILEFLHYMRESEIIIQQQSKNSDGIRISTIHGAKGLESPVVCLLDFNLESDKNKVKFIWKENDDMLFFIKPSKNKSFEEAEIMINSEYEEENKELLRLLYVAMTRPRDSLYVFGGEDEKAAFHLIKEKIDRYA